MRYESQQRLIREALAALERGTPPLSAAFTRNDPRAYTAADRAAREREVLFHDYPIVAGFSSQIRRPGDFITDDLAPTPILIVRNASGELRAFANICRHRGARLARGCGNVAARFTCPYHAWSYDTDGRLRALPDDYGFAGLDRETHGLIRFSVAERYGMIWVMPRAGAAFDLEAHLGGLGAELEAAGVDGFELRESRVVRRRMNWKLVSDTFWEAYHIKVLHKSNIAPLFARNLAIFEPFGRCQRLAGIRNSIAKLRDVPPAEWDLLPHATLLMNLFPNTVFLLQSDHVEVFRIFPSPDHPGESVTEINLLGPGPDSPARYDRRWDGEDGSGWSKVMELLVGVIEQDFEVGESIQRNFAAGVLDEVVYGRFEPALEHFHRSIRAALGE
jgi:phenylpropionate dioxygenase-like ring-hydroxylating dioxygenase large terminal subunit